MDLAYAKQVMERLNALAGISEEPDKLTRRFASPAMRQANSLAAQWMREAGMTVRQDNIGNLIGRYGESRVREWGEGEEGIGNSDLPSPHSFTLLLGSHLDTVRDAGKYDGPLGVIVAIACVQRLHDHNTHLPFAIEVVAFADEEGLRYHTAYLGSKAYVGAFDLDLLNLTDADGITLSEAIKEFGGDPARVQSDARSGDDLLGYCEVHIEQGPVLEAQDLPVAVVSAIAGQSRIGVQFVGEAGHAGTVPMHMRHDALCAASEFVVAAEAFARDTQGLVATVGQIAAHPGASNVIPGRVALSLDVRHIDDATREQACSQLREHARQICDVRRLSLNWQPMQTTRSVPCSSQLSDLLAQAIGEQGYSPMHLPSGAGHDAVTLSKLTEVAMLFVRCKGGVSHNPDESVELEDVAIAIGVIGRFLELIATLSSDSQPTMKIELIPDP